MSREGSRTRGGDAVNKKLAGALQRMSRSLLLAAMAASVAAGLACPSAFAANGGRWTRVPLQVSNVAVSVSCPSRTFCLAVDSDGHAARFNGHFWSAPRLIDSESLTSVSCPSRSFCVAVDQAGGVVSFDGRSWRRHGVLQYLDGFTSVSCVSRLFCAAVDALGNALMFNGRTWSAAVRVEPAEAYGGGSLNSVSCSSSSFCAAVDDAGNAFTFNGHSWSATENIEPVTGLGTSLDPPLSRRW